MPLVWSIGSVFGPSFGGFFARPAEHYPWLFGNSELLKKYPFLLPNLVASIFFLISVATATLFLKVCCTSLFWPLARVVVCVHPVRLTTKGENTGNAREQAAREGLGPAYG